GARETGVLAFERTDKESDTASALEYEARVLVSNPDSASLAIVAFGDGQAVFGLDPSEPDSSGWLWDGSVVKSVPFPDNGYGRPDRVRPAVFGSTPAVAVGFPGHLVFYEAHRQRFAARRARLGRDRIHHDIGSRARRTGHPSSPPRSGLGRR